MNDWDFYPCSCGQTHPAGIVCAIGKRANQKLLDKWKNAPTTKHQAERAVERKLCPICDSSLLLAIIRPPIDVWKVHCNHCATEMPIAVLLNREAWKVNRKAWKV